MASSGDLQEFPCMSAERWERTKQILEEALRIAPGRRQAYLDLVCGPDSELRAEVESLIASHEEAGSAFLDRKSTRLNSSHGYISYAVFCLKKKKRTTNHATSLF